MMDIPLAENVIHNRIVKKQVNVKIHLFQFADKVCKLKQTETNEVIFHEKRASAYKGKAVEFFVKTLEITIDNYHSL